MLGKWGSGSKESLLKLFASSTGAFGNFRGVGVFCVVSSHGGAVLVVL